MDKNFTRGIFDWLEAVCSDRRLWPTAFKLAFAISRHINRESRTAWPSQATLAQAIGTDARTVRRLTDQLVKAGYLHVEPQRGRHQTSVYSIVESRTPTPSFHEGETGRVRPLFGDIKPDVYARLDRTCTPEKPDMCVRKSGRVRPTNYRRTIEEPLKEPLRGKTVAPKRPRGSCLSSEWNPSQSDIDFALSEGMTEHECQRQAERFRDYWIGCGKPKKDWGATWRNWVRREVDSPKAGRAGKPSLTDIALSTGGWGRRQ